MSQVKRTFALAIIIIIISGMAAGVARAQTAPAPAPAAEPASPFTGNVGLWSQYIFRGLSQTDYKPALQGGFDYAHDSGLYAGVWASNIKWLHHFHISSSNVEVDLYGGYRKAIGDFGYDVGFLRYQYPGSVEHGAINPNTSEVYIAGSWNFVTLKYSHALTNAFGTPESKHSAYLDLTAAIPVADTWTLTLHAGRQKFRGPASALATYNDIKAEIAKDFGNGLSAGAGVTSTDADKSFYTPPDQRSVAKDTGYVFVKYNF